MRGFIASLMLSVVVVGSVMDSATAQDKPTSAAPSAAAPSSGPAPAPAPAPLPPLNAEAFAKLPFVDEADISPNGKNLAGLLAVQGVQTVTIVSLLDKSVKPVAVRVPDGTQARWVRWVNDDNILVGLTVLLPVETDRWYVSRIVAINRTTGKLTPLLWDKNGQSADLIWTPSDGSEEILISAQASIYSDDPVFWPAVYRVNVVTGKARVVVPSREYVMDWSADGAGTVRSGVGYNDNTRTSRLLYRGEGQSSFQTVDRADQRKDDRFSPPFMFVPGTNNGLVYRDNKAGQTSVYEINLSTQADVRTVFEPKAGDVEGVIRSADGKELLGLVTSDQTIGTVWLDPKLAAIQASFDKAVTRGRASIVSVNQDRSKLLVRISAPDMPGSYYYYDEAVGLLQRLAYSNSVIASRRLAPVKLVQYKARDGLAIEGVLTLPANKDPKNLPFIVMPHGGPWGQDTLSYDYWAQFVASLGYAVLQPNFRGSTGYGTAFVEKGHGELGKAMQDDVTDGVNWAVKAGIADPKRVCIMGASYGGYAAMWGTVKDPDFYRCSISISGVANLRREVNDFGGKLRGNQYTAQWKQMAPDFAAVSPMNFVEKIKTPMLLIHGKKDVTVDHSQSARMHAAMRSAGKTVEFVSIPLADHYFTREVDRVTLLKAIEAFLKKHNPS